MKKLLTVLVVLLVSTLFFAESLVILHTSDLHGNVFPIDYSNGMASDVGLGKVSTVIKAERAANPNNLLIDTGDLIQGVPFAFYNAKINPEGVQPMMKLMNVMKFDASILGNHEFNYGMNSLNKAISDARFPFLSANIFAKKNAEPAFKPYVIKQVGDIKVAILGLTTKFIPNWEEPKNIANFSFIDPVEVAKMYVPMLRKQADVVVVAYHGGFEKNIKTKVPNENEPVGENQGIQLMQEVPGIDVLLTGHQHQEVFGVYDNIAVTQPNSWGRKIGKVTLNLEKTNGKWEIKDKKAELIATNNAAPDKELLKLVQDKEDKVQKWLSAPVGMSKGDFYVENPDTLRMKDNALMEFVNKVQMHYSGAKISSTALFSNSIKGWKNGPVTIRDVNSVYIYPNTLKVLLVSGKDIKDALEKVAEYWVYDAATGKLSTNPNFRAYNYDMWEGVSFKMVVSEPVGNRVKNLSVDGKPIEMEGKYEVVLNNYRAGGGGSYLMFKGKPVVREVLKEVSELMVEYLLTYKNIEATVDNNWEVVVK